MGNEVRETKVPGKGSLRAEGFVTKVTEVLPRSGQQLYLGAIGDRRRRGPPPKYTPKGGLQKEEVESKPV
eukprot:9771421-Prorocentrum_lima.AAC.1